MANALFYPTKYPLCMHKVLVNWLDIAIFAGLDKYILEYRIEAGFSTLSGIVSVVLTLLSKRYDACYKLLAAAASLTSGKNTGNVMYILDTYLWRLMPVSRSKMSEIKNAKVNSRKVLFLK